MRKSLGLALTAAMTFAFTGPVVVAQADTVGPTTFETYSVGSVNGQNGWTSAEAFDQGVVNTLRYPADFGGKALRISNSVVSGSFGDQPMSAGLAKPAGEKTAENHFDSTFQIGSMSAQEQPGLKMSVSPDDGNGARMSYLRFEDQPTGVDVIFAEAKDTGPIGTKASFPETTIATLGRESAHTIRFSIDFVDGPSNDVAEIYIDGVLKKTGTTWENYFRFDPEAAGTGNTVRPVSKLLFRLGGGAIPAATDTQGQGFLIDNVELASSTTAAAASEFPISFESSLYDTGSVNEQNGWTSAEAFDQGVVPTTRYQSFGGQALRISNAVTSGSFGDQTFSPAIAKPAGEAPAENHHFDSTFEFGTMQGEAQSGLALSVSPDNGSGGRMSYLRFADQTGGVDVFFDDVTNPTFGAISDFRETKIATLDRKVAHTIRFSIDFLGGPANDVAKIYIDGALKITGTTWEDHYRNDPESSGGGYQVLPVSKLLFRAAGTAQTATTGKGFLFDNVTLASSVATADPDPLGKSTFENYFTGSVNGQNGWSSTGGYDQAVTAQSLYPAFGTQSLRISNAVTSGAFGNQTFSPPVANPAGESTAFKHFDSTFQIGTAVTTPQPGLFMSVSPDDGNGGRMSWLGFEDLNGAIHMTFDDVTDTGPLYKEANFSDTEIATFEYGTAHTIRYSMDFFTGPGNDVVKIYIDGVLKHTGTTWEDYYRYDNEQSKATPPVGAQPPTVSKLLFKEGGTAVPATRGNGFLIDNVTLASSAGTASAPTLWLSGTVTASAVPVSSGVLHVFNAAGVGVRSTAISASGTYSLSSLPMGDYKLYVVSSTAGYPSQWVGGANFASATTIHFTASATQNIALRGVAPMLSLSGAVTAGAVPVTSGVVHVFNAAGVGVRSTAISSLGKYSVSSLPTGDYKLYVVSSTAGYPSQWVGGANFASATTIHFTASATQNIALQGVAPLLSLSGAVTAGAVPVTSGVVHVFNAAGVGVRSTAISSLGKYSVSSLPTGDYKLYLVSSTAGYPSQWVGGANFASATTIHFTASATQNIALLVSPITAIAKIVGADDIGTCNNVWAKDTYDKKYRLTQTGNGAYALVINYDNGTFVTVAGMSPGACENAPMTPAGIGTNNGNMVVAGITGTQTQVWNGTVATTKAPNLSPNCSNGACDKASGFLNAVFGAGVEATGWTQTGTYTTTGNGTWFDTQANWPLNDTGDIQ